MPLGCIATLNFSLGVRYETSYRGVCLAVILGIIQRLFNVIVGNGATAGKAVVVLVVDDEPDDLDVMVRAIGPLDVVVMATSNLRTAHNMILTSDILVLGWHDESVILAMDVMDRWVSNKHGPMCVVCKDVTEEEENELFIAGAYNVFNKPVGFDVLCVAIRRYKVDVDSQRLIAVMHENVKRLRYIVFVLLFVTMLSGVETVSNIATFLKGVL